MMLHVKNIMRRVDKTVHIDHPLTEAQLRMTKYGLDFIPVVDGDEIVGVLEKDDMFSESDATTHASNGDKVKDRLSGELVFCFETDTVETARDTMETSGRDRLIVVNGKNQLAGVLTRQMVEDKLKKQEVHSAGTETPMSDRKTNTGGRAHGDDPGKPANYSAAPFVNKDGK